MRLSFRGAVRLSGAMMLTAPCLEAAELVVSSPIPLVPDPATAPSDTGTPPPMATGRAEPEPGRIAFSMGLFLYQVIGAGVGANLGAHVGPTTLVEIDGYLAGALIPTFGSRSIALRVQQFAGRRFYVRGGLRGRRLVVKDLLDLDLGKLRKRTLQTDLGVDVAVGHRWNVGSVAVGVDWAGVYVPLTALETDSRTIDPQNGEILAQEEPALRMLPDVRLGYLQVGTTF